MWDAQDTRPLPAANIKLVALGLDGTLLREDQTVSARAQEAIAEALRRGVKIVLASARPPRAMRSCYKQLGLDTHQINHNGALISDPLSNKVLFHRPLESEIARSVFKVAREADRKVIVGVDSGNEAEVDYPARRDSEGQKTSKLERLFNKQVSKLMLAGEPDRLMEVHGVIKRKLAGQVAMTFSKKSLLQVVHPEVDKAAALAVVAGHYKVPKECVMAIGDAPNDLGMLKWAGMSVAMGDAWPAVSKAAHFRVGNMEEDGVAQALEKYALL